MKMHIGGALLLAALLVMGCAAGASNLNGLDLGMNRAEVVSVMGEPHSVSEVDDVLYLRYWLRTGSLFTEEHFVRLTGGKVDAYGRRGDFGIGY